MWTIVSAGDANFIEQILISVAMVTGTGDFLKGAGIAMLIGVLLMFFQAIIKGGQEFNIGAVLVGWILFMIMFIPSTTVAIEDRVTGNTRVVANVPIGVAAPGSIISTIGYGLTELFEQGYSYIGGITDGTFAESLNILNSLRSNKNNPSLFASLNDNLPPGTDLRLSWDNYMRECAFRKIDLNQATLDEMAKEPIETALRFDSTIYMTQIKINGSAEVINCSQAYGQLMAITSAQLTSGAFAETLTLLLNPSADPTNAVAGLTKTNDALQVLGIATTNAQNFIKASLLVPIYEQAAIGRYQDLQDFSSAIAMNQAIAQRNTQWTMEQSMFMSLIRPLQTFFEGFVYAITPILAMLIVTGSFGFSMAGKYLQLLFWVQLWLPMLSIINLYILTSANIEMGAYDSRNITSMYTLNEINQLVQNWVSTGGMLAAAVPLIALFVVTGSTYAFTSIASRLNGADHTNEKISTPDVVKPAEMMKQEAMKQNDTVLGTINPGAQSLMGSMTLGKTAQTMVSSAESKAKEASDSFAETFTNTATRGGSFSASSGLSTSLSQGAKSLDSRQRKSMDSMAQQISSITGQDLTSSRVIANQIAAGVNMDARVGVGGGGAGVSSGAQRSDTRSSSDSVSLKELQSMVKGSGWSKDDTIAYQGEVGAAIMRGNSEEFRSEIGEKDANALQKASQDIVKSSNSYTAAKQFSNNVGAQGSMNLREVAAQMNSGSTPWSQEASKGLDGFYTYSATPEQRQAAERLERTLASDSVGLSPDMARTTARLQALTMGSAATPESLNAATSIMSSALGYGQSDPINAQENAGIPAREYGATGLQTRVEAGTAGAVGAAGAARGMGDSFVDQSLTPAPTVFPGENENYNQNLSVVQENYAANEAPIIQEQNNAMQAAHKTQGEAFKKASETQAQNTSGSNFEKAYAAVQGDLDLSLSKFAAGDSPYQMAYQAASDAGLSPQEAEYYGIEKAMNLPGANFASDEWTAQTTQRKEELATAIGADRGQDARYVIGMLDSAAKVTTQSANNILTNVGSHLNRDAPEQFDAGSPPWEKPGR